MAKYEKLFDQFPPVTTKEWLDRINADLKGADFNKKLIWKTNEGFDVKPFYRQEDLEQLPYIDTLPGQFPYIRGTKDSKNDWLVRQNIIVSDYHNANEKALSILMRGVESLGFNIQDPESVNEENFEILLKDIHPEAVELNFQCNGKAKEIINILSGYLKRRGSNLDNVRGAFEADPLSRLMINGTLCIPPEQGFDYLAGVVKDASLLPLFRLVNINASNFRNAGGNIVQELAFGMSMGCEYLSQLTERGIDIREATRRIRFSFGTGSSYFQEIAKLRAARLLWSAVVNGFDPSRAASHKMEIHSVTGEWNKTVYDPYVNMLRTQTEAMSAVLGGTDSLTVGPFDTVFRSADEFSERIARNQQLILREEAYFDKVTDPSAGSYYIENLTNLLADEAWKMFLEVEEKGGFLACLKEGFIQEKLSLSSGKLMKDLSSKKTVLLGTNQYPDPNEKLSDSADMKRVLQDKIPSSDLTVTPVKFIRGSEQFDKLRIAVEKSGKRPVVFLLSIGNPVMRKARAQFSAGFFGCAGYRIIDGPAFDNVEQAVESALGSNAEIVVICSSDDEYPVYGPEIFKKISGKAIVVIAGNPSCADELRSSGINNYIHLKSDIVAVLTDYNSKLGIKPL